MGEDTNTQGKFTLNVTIGVPKIIFPRIYRSKCDICSLIYGGKDFMWIFILPQKFQKRLGMWLWFCHEMAKKDGVCLILLFTWHGKNVMVEGGELWPEPPPGCKWPYIHDITNKTLRLKQNVGKLIFIASCIIHSHTFELLIGTAEKWPKLLFN